MKTLSSLIVVLTLVSGLAASQPAQAQVKIAFKSSFSGLYVRAGVGPNSGLSAWSPRVFQDGWERFEYVPSAGNRFRLRSLKSGLYVTVYPDGYLHATHADDVFPNSTLFEFISLDGGDFAIRSVSNGKYVRAGVGPYSRLAAVATKVYPRGWERFRWERLRD